MNFAFKGRNGRGELVEGIVDAVNSDAVAAQLMAGGVVPVSIEATSEAISVAGGSYGGYMSLACMEHYADTLRCGIDVVYWRQ